MDNTINQQLNSLNNENETGMKDQGFVVIEGIRIYGEAVLPMEEEEVSMIDSKNLFSELHMIRHFSWLNPDYKKTLASRIEAEYPDENGEAVIENILTANRGGGFDGKTIGLQTPVEVMEQAKSVAAERAGTGELFWIRKGNRLVAHFSFALPMATGNNEVVNLEDLEVGYPVETMLRGNSRIDRHEIQVVRGLKPQPTNRIAVALSWSDHESCPKVITAFPGNVAADCPAPQDTLEEREYNRQFWSKRAFIDLRNQG